MENYFWVASQSHFFELFVTGYGANNHLSSSKLAVDVLALVGPNRRVLEVGEKRVTCLVKAIMARAFEIALLMERQTSMTPLEGYWLDTAKSLIGDAAQSNFKIRPCPVYNSGEFGSVPGSDSSSSNRSRVDVSDCSIEDFQILRWALADLEEPLTALGRAWGEEKYTLIDAPDCISGETESVPDDLWMRILSLLSRLGVEDLTIRLARAAVFVWDLVECPVHRGLGETMVIDLAEEFCRCSLCDGSRQEVKLWAPQEQTLETYSNSSADELSHKWWTCEETAGPNEGFIHKWWTCEETAALNENIEVPKQFNLRPETTVEDKVTLPTTESLKLRTVKTLAQLEDFRLLLIEHLRRAGDSKSEVAKLPRDVLQREVERIISHSDEVSASVAEELLNVSPARTSRDLVFRIERLHAESSTTAHLPFFYGLGESRTEWTRLKYLSPRCNYKYLKATEYLLRPCRLFTVSAVDNVLYNFQDCKTCPTPSFDGPYDYDSTVELSTRGRYGSAIWKLIKAPNIGRNAVERC